MIRPIPRLVMAALAAATLAVSGAPAAAQGQSAPPPVPASPGTSPDHPAYGDLIEAIDASVNWEAFYDITTATIAREYAQVPEFAALEKEKPGLIDAVVRAMRPVLEGVMVRLEDDYRPRKRALLARYLTPGEAKDLAAFYRSPLGMRIVDQASRNMASGAMLESLDQEIMSGKDSAQVEVTKEQVTRDFDEAVRSTTDAMSGKDLAELARLAAEKPALLKLATIRGEMLTLQTQMANEQPTAGEIAAIEQAVIAAIEAHIAK